MKCLFAPDEIPPAASLWDFVGKIEAAQKELTKADEARKEERGQMGKKVLMQVENDVLASQISFRFFLSHVLYPSIKACLEKVNWRHPKEHKEELSDFNVTLVDQKATQKLLTKALDSLKAQKGQVGDDV